MLFTVANAKEMAAKAVQARRDREIERQTEPVAASVTPEALTDYTARQLTQVRAHLQRIDKLMTAATDALDLDRLARARSSLAEQERKLAGRPDPGSFRPTKAKERVADVQPL